MTQNGQKWVYFGPFRPKIDPKMVSYKIVFTKKWFFSAQMKKGHKNHFMVRVIIYKTIFGSIFGLKGPK